MVSFNVQRSSVQSLPIDGVAAYRTVLTIVSNVGAGTNKIFVVDQPDEDAVPSFLYVASAADLDDLDEAPDFNLDKTSFRVDSVTVTCDDANTLEEFVDSCKRRIKTLALALQTIGDYSSTEVTTISA